MWGRNCWVMFSVLIIVVHLASCLTSTDSSKVTTNDKTTVTPQALTSTAQDTTAASTSSSTEPSSSSTTPAESTATEASTATSTSTLSSSPPSTTTRTTSTTTSTTTAQPQYSTEWQDIEEGESEKLVNFVVSEIQKLKMEHKELDDCQELDLSSVLSGKKLNGKTVKYSITLKVQPQVKNTEECLQQNSTMNNMHPEICEADVTEGDRGGTDERTLLRSTCLQVEELQD